MNWKQKRQWKVIGIVALLIVAAYFLYPLNESIKLGLDLKGGTHVVLEAQDTEQTEVNADSMQRVKKVIERRVNKLGLTKPVIQLQGERRIIVELPGVKNPNQAVEMIGKTAQLKFKNEAGEVLLTGEYLKNAEAAFDQRFNRPVIHIEFNSEGTDKWAQITRNNVGRKIGIYLDGERLTYPEVQEAMTKGKSQITGFQNFEEAQRIAKLLQAGALPVPVEILENRTVGPTLGAMAIDKSVTAGIVGLILIVIFMTAMYRLPGFIAAIALAFYSVIVFGVMAGLNATLTLPGIAGLILSIGMAVDANVIIFERIKYEHQAGKTIKAAVDSGFERAFRTILDSNVTTLITAAILGYFGTETIKGFAITLSIGIVTSMLTAIVVTRMLVNLALDTELLKKDKLLGWSRG